MSEKQAPFDDPFADLFSNLPSPGAGASAHKAEPEASQPHSRREAREAAAREPPPVLHRVRTSRLA